MKARTFLSGLVLPLIFLVQAEAQNVHTINVRPQLSREKIYTLKPGESIHYNEYALNMRQAKTGYAFVIVRKEKLWLRYNGKELGPYRHVANVNNDYRYWICYNENNATVIDIETERRLGPYSSIYQSSYSDANPTFQCEKDGKKFLCEMKSGKKIGPYKNLHVYRFDEQEQLFAYQQEEGGWYLKSGRKTFGPFEKQPYVSRFPEQDTWAVQVLEKFESYPSYILLKDGRKFGCSEAGYTNSSFFPLDKERWLFAREEAKEKGSKSSGVKLAFSTSDGADLGTFEVNRYTLFVQGGRFAFTGPRADGSGCIVYLDGKALSTHDGLVRISYLGKNDLYYSDNTTRELFRNGTNTGLVLGTRSYHSFRTSPDGKQLLYTAADGVYKNGRKIISLPENASSTFDWGFTPDGNGSYVIYQENAATLLRTGNGRTYGPYNYFDRHETISISADQAHVAYIANGYAHVDGKRFDGNAFRMSYDEEDSAYRWITLDKKDIYLSTYEIE